MRSADKFPIRCRLFSNYATYTDSDPVAPGMQPYIWPNNQPPLTSYVEGGCYVSDTGLPVYKVRIATNGVPIVAGMSGAYSVTLPFVIKFGSPNYTVTVDTDYDGMWGSAPTGRVFPVTGFDNTTSGAKIGTVNITTLPDGNYNFAIRVVDNNGDISTAAYPAQVPLFPTSIFLETFEGGAHTPANSDLTWSITGPQGNYNHDWESRTAPDPFFGYTAHAGSRYVRWNTTDQYIGSPTGRYATTGPYTINPNTFYRIELYTNGSTAYVLSYYNMGGLSVQYSFDNTNWTHMPTSMMYYEHTGSYYMSFPSYYYTELGRGTWTYHKKDFTSGPANTQIWFRYGMETDPYGYIDMFGDPNDGGPAVDDIKMYPPPPPPPPVWTETFETGMGNWSQTGSSGTITMVQGSGAALGGPSGAQGGTYYCMTTPRNYPSSSWCRYRKTTPITVSPSTTYSLKFYTGGNTEANYDGLMVGYSFDGSILDLDRTEHVLRP